MTLLGVALPSPLYGSDRGEPVGASAKRCSEDLETLREVEQRCLCVLHVEWDSGRAFVLRHNQRPDTVDQVWVPAQVQRSLSDPFFNSASFLPNGPFKATIAARI